MPTRPTAETSRRRTRPLRCEDPEQLFFVSTRTLEEVFWLHPLLCSPMKPLNREARRLVDAKRTSLRRRLGRLVATANARRPSSQPQLSVDEAEAIARDLIASALARAQRHCAADGSPRVEVFAALVMSNHVHLVVRAPAKNLAAFMGYFVARVAQSLNLLLGRVGPVFPRRYDAQPILDERAAHKRIQYLLDNPKTAGLVRRFDHWPGFVAVAGLTEQNTLDATYFDRTRWQLDGKPDHRDRYWLPCQLKLSPLPGMHDLDARQYLRILRSWCSNPGPHDHFLGIDGVLDVDVHARPTRPKRKRRPYAFGAPDLVRAFRNAARLRHQAYDLAMSLWRRGVALIDWPPGTYPPGRSVAA